MILRASHWMSVSMVMTSIANAHFGMLSLTVS